MSRRKHSDERLPPFVPLFRETMAMPAWRALSHGARVLYIALKARCVKNNGHVYLSQRDAAKEIGSKQEYVARWYRELQHYGFIVMTSAGGLGVDGRGKAPHWRLSELPCFGERATRDFAKWDGMPFRDRPKKQNPESQKGLGVSPKRDSVVSPKRGSLNGTSESQKGGIRAPIGESQKGLVTILATRGRSPRATGA
jgi:hypothetical protein